MKKPLPDLTSAPSICQNVILLAKETFLNVGPKLYYLGLFVLELGRATLLWYFTSSPIFLNRKFQTKIKILKFGTNIALIGYFRLEFQKSNILFVISFREFVSRQSFIQNKKNILQTKNALFASLGWNVEKLL